MKLRHLLKLLHVAGTVWLIGCAAFLLIVALRQAGAGWWVIFSVSGFSGIAFLFSTSIYLFAVFRGVVRKQLAEEHPLTSSGIYLLFYDSCPILGSLAGLISAEAIAAAPLEWFSLAAEGSLIMTFLIWILGDPLLGLAEGLLPSCAAARRARLAAETETRRRRQENRQRLLEQIRWAQQAKQKQWSRQLLPLAERILASMQQKVPRDRLRRESVEIGAQAWQQGGTQCMQHLLVLVSQL
ncbi:MAG TPA: hypothetical protein PK965_10960, partial [Anaerohalosphaeraceae bacterium]|nr:hypothetical protein [Anaerohalosphaeraceae bacterium]